MESGRRNAGAGDGRCPECGIAEPRVVVKRWRGKRAARALVALVLVGYMLVCVVSAGGLWKFSRTYASTASTAGRVLERPFVSKQDIASTDAPSAGAPEWLAKVVSGSGASHSGATLHVGFHDPANVMSQTTFGVGWPVEVGWCRVHDIGDVRSRGEHAIQWRRPRDAVAGPTFFWRLGYVANWSTPGGLTQRTRISFDAFLAFVPIFLALWLCFALTGRVARKLANRSRPEGLAQRPKSRWLACVPLVLPLFASAALMLVPHRSEILSSMGPVGANFEPFDTGLTRETIAKLANSSEGLIRLAEAIRAAPGREEDFAQFLYIVPSSVSTTREWSSTVLGEDVMLHYTHEKNDPMAETPQTVRLIDDGVSIELTRALGDRPAKRINIAATILQPLGSACLFALAVRGLLAAPGWWLERRDRRRASRGLCVGCAYDLSGQRHANA